MRQKETAVIPIPRRMEITAVLHFLRRHDKLPFAVCIYTCEEMRDCKGNILFAAEGREPPCWHTILLRKV